MLTKNKPSERFLPVLGMLLGGVVFLVIYGHEILNPAFIEWTLEGDAAQHFLGWHFFRSEPWSFPLGLIRSYQYPQGTSLVYTDSIPLLAIPLKLLSPILPTVFQYHGIWLLLTYVLQGFFSTLLLRQITKNPIIIFLGMSFFLLSPVLVQRSRVHESLAGHWIILAALYLYFQADSFASRIRWLLLMVVASLVHFYLFLMALIIFSGYILRQVLGRERKILISLLKFSAAIVIFTGIAMWLAGYFIFDVRFTGSGGFGRYSMNLLSPVNASPIANIVGDFVFLKSITLATTDQLFEGFNYLGFGLLLLILFSAFELIRHKGIISIQENFPLILIGLVLLAISLSSKVTIADTVLFELDLPYAVQGGLGIIRSSGRMFWPISYMLILAAIAVVIKCNSAKRSIFLLLVFVCLQAIDFSPWYRNVNFSERSWDSPLQSPQWSRVAEETDHIVFVPPNRYEADFVPFALLAAAHGNTINFGSTARDDLEAREEYRATLLQEFKEGRIKSDTLYVIRDEESMPSSLPTSDFSWGILDGYPIIVPKLGSLDLHPWTN